MFKFQLALRLGRTVSELEQTMSAREFDMWQAFNLFEPIGVKREDSLFAFLGYMNALFSGAKDINLKQFMIYNDHDHLFEDDENVEIPNDDEIEDMCVNLKAMFSKII